MVFRRAAAADLPDIMRAVGEAQAFMRTLGIDQWQDGYPEPETLLNDIRLGQLYIYEDAGRVAAFAALSQAAEPVYDDIDGAWLTAGPYLTLHRMALDDAHRGGGLAAGMVRRAEALARECGCVSLRVDTHTGNRAMRRFLEKQGFRHCGTVCYAVKKGDPLRVAYEKPL